MIGDYLHGEQQKVTNAVDDYNATIAISRLFLGKACCPRGFFIAGLAYPEVFKWQGELPMLGTFNVGMQEKSFDDNFLHHWRHRILFDG